MCFLPCLAQHRMMAGVIQMRQPQKEGETLRDKIWATHKNPPQNNFLLKNMEVLVLFTKEDCTYLFWHQQLNKYLLNS